MRIAMMILAAAGAVVGHATVAPSPAGAWGKFGHLTICDLAYRNLTPASRTAMNDLLQAGRGGITVEGRGRMPDRHYTSFNMGCLEEDEIPRAHENDHFINVARNVSTIDGATCPGGTDCILSGIDRDLAILKDTSRTRGERVLAMMALGRWVGDIHQPLHVSFADDKGGNGIDIDRQARCGTSREAAPDNLHAVWDKCLLDAGLFERVRKRADFKRTWSRFTITYRAVDTLIANTGVAEERRMVGGEPWTWANESIRVTTDPATGYCVWSGPDCRYSASSVRKSNPKRVQLIDQAYLSSHEALAQERVRLAGFRLAHLLNSALDPSYREPARDGAQGS